MSSKFTHRLMYSLTDTYLFMAPYASPVPMAPYVPYGSLLFTMASYSFIWLPMDPYSSLWLPMSPKSPYVSHLSSNSKIGRVWKYLQACLYSRHLPLLEDINFPAQSLLSNFTDISGLIKSSDRYN
jgi:hypothetical protein